MAGPGRDVAAFGYWWLTNESPPVATIEGPATAVRGEISARAVVQPSDRADVVAASLDGQDLRLGRAFAVDTRALPDGEHVLAVRVEDHSRRRNASTASLRFSSDNTPPRLQLTFRPAGVAQGRTVLLRVGSDEPAELRLEVDGTRLPLYPVEGEHWAVLGIGPARAVGARLARVWGQDAVGNDAAIERPLSVAAHRFPEDHLQVPPTLAALLAPEARADEERRLRAVYAPVNGPPLWSGRFRRPVGGEVTTEFGEIRTYNGGPPTGHHAGTDFAAPQGAPVVSPARARVALREEVRLRGKVLVLDHGAGVFTTYAHLADWLVEAGAEVQAGQRIALVGNTGLSTGPHLHWELWVGGENVDPLEWTEQAFP